jgi:plastocyanin
MKILRNAVITSAALILGVGTVAHASGNGGHSDDNRTSYYGQPSSRGHDDNNRAGYYGQPSTTSAPSSSATRVNRPHKQVLAKEVSGTYLFAARTVRIKVGTKIIWSNRSDAEHNVTFNKNAKVDMDFEPNKSVSYTFKKPGTYAYHCEYHPYMKGTIVVHR